MKAETPDMTDEALFEAMKVYLASAAPAATTEGEAAPAATTEAPAAPVEGEAAPVEGETPQEVAPPVEE